jgi:hypothetical protein
MFHIPQLLVASSAISTANLLFHSLTHVYCLYKSYPLLQYLAPALIYSSSYTRGAPSNSFTKLYMEARKKTHLERILQAHFLHDVVEGHSLSELNRISAAFISGFSRTSTRTASAETWYMESFSKNAIHPLGGQGLTGA